MRRILYITYDGLMEPLGQSQVLQYLKTLAMDYDISLVSYEKQSDWQDSTRRDAFKEEVCRYGIRWTPLKYHRKPTSLATAYDLLVGFFVCMFLVAVRRITIVHARSYVPSVLALAIKKLLGTKFIFDMRGFWADERVERAGWQKESKIYRIAKWFEHHFFLNADAVVSLTHAGINEIVKFPYLKNNLPAFEVIPTCTNLDKFKIIGSKNNKSFTLGYVGSASAAYMFEPVLRCFSLLGKIRVNAKLLIITHTDHDYVKQLLKEYSIPAESVEIKSVLHDDVVYEMNKMDAGIFFVKPGFSSSASVPTKLGEFLACGVPCFSNAGIGDIESILEGRNVGIVIREFTSESELEAVSRLIRLLDDPEINNRCRHVAEEYFALENGVKAYDRVYKSLSGDL